MEKIVSRASIVIMLLLAIYLGYYCATQQSEIDTLNKHLTERKKIIDVLSDENDRLFSHKHQVLDENEKLSDALREATHDVEARKEANIKLLSEFINIGLEENKAKQPKTFRPLLKEQK